MTETTQWHVGWVLEISAPETDRWKLSDHIEAANVTDLRGRPPTTVVRERGLFRIPAWAPAGDESQPQWLMRLLRLLTETHGYQARVIYDPWPREEAAEAPETTSDIVTDMRIAEMMIRDQHRVSHPHWGFWHQVAGWLNEMASDAQHGTRVNDRIIELGSLARDMLSRFSKYADAQSAIVSQQQVADWHAILAGKEPSRPNWPRINGAAAAARAYIHARSIDG